MRLDDQLRRYFDTDDLDSVPPDVLAVGIEKMRVDLGLQSDRGYRFALWSLLFLMGEAPDLDVTFEDEDDRDAARTFMDITEAGGR